MAYQKLQPERAYVIPGGVNFDLTKDNPFVGIKQTLAKTTDFTFTVSGGTIDTITLRTVSYTQDYSNVPTVTVSGGSGTGATASASFDSNGKLVITSGATGSGYLAGDNIVITLSGYTVLPHARLQPFTVYTGSCTSLGSAYSGAGDSMGTVPCAANQMLPIQFSALTPATNSVIALW